MFPLLVAVLTVIILLRFIPPIQELFHWIKPVGMCVSISKFGVDYDIGMYVP